MSADIRIYVTDREGTRQELIAPTDMQMNLMEVCKAYELPVEGTCGGMALCASCQCYIESSHLPLLERVNISPENWLKLTTQFTRVFHGAVGRPTSQASYCENLSRKRRANISNCVKLLA